MVLPAPSPYPVMHRGVLKVRKLTELITKYVHHILSLFNSFWQTEMLLVRRFSNARIPL